MFQLPTGPTDSWGTPEHDHFAAAGIPDPTHESHHLNLRPPSNGERTSDSQILSNCLENAGICRNQGEITSHQLPSTAWLLLPAATSVPYLSFGAAHACHPQRGLLGHRYPLGRPAACKPKTSMDGLGCFLPGPQPAVYSPVRNVSLPKDTEKNKDHNKLIVVNKGI